MSVFLPVIQGVYPVALSAVRVATLVIVRDQIINANDSAGNKTGINPETSGMIAYLNITVAPGVETLQLVLEEQEPISGGWSSIAATLATTVTGLVKLKIKPAITIAAASTSGVSIQDVLPANWRLRVVHSAGSNWTYSLAVTLYS